MRRARFGVDRFTHTSSSSFLALPPCREVGWRSVIGSGPSTPLDVSVEIVHGLFGRPGGGHLDESLQSCDCVRVSVRHPDVRTVKGDAPGVTANRVTAVGHGPVSVGPGRRDEFGDRVRVSVRHPNVRTIECDTEGATANRVTAVGHGPVGVGSGRREELLHRLWHASRVKGLWTVGDAA